MKNYNPIYYLLFVLLIMGAFASMAQNDYGMTLLGIVAGVFSLLFIIQVAQKLLSGQTELASILELFCLVILSLIIALRIFYIRFQFVEIVFGAAGLVLIVVYGQRLLKTWKTISTQSKVLAILIGLFYSSIILYTVSMVTVPFFPDMAEPAGGLAFALVIAFGILSLRKKNIIVSGEKVSGLKYVTKFKDRSVLLLALFLLFTAYMGFTKIGVLPKMYSDEFPQTYFELVKLAETGREKPVNGKYKHEEFKENYDRFIERTNAAKK